MNPTLQHADVRGPSFKHFLLLCAAAALWIDFSHVHRTLNSDTLMFSIASQHAWTPFFWEQDRIGMFVPLMTTWCSDPLAILLMQTAITAFMGLAIPVLLVELVYPKPAGRLGAILANALMLALAPDRVRDNLLFECCYPQAIFLGCAGLWILGTRDRPAWWRYPISFGLFVLAHWIYLGVCVWLMPLALWIAAIRPGIPIGSFREFAFRLVRYFPGWSSLVLLGGALWMGYWFMTMANEAAGGQIVKTPMKGLPMEEWAESWRGFWDCLNAWPGMIGWEWTATGLAIAGASLALWPRFRPGFALPAACLVLLIVGATEYLFMGTRSWPSRNEYHLRYILGTIICAQLILGLAAAAPLSRWAAGSGRWPAFALAVILLFAAAAFQYGFPTPATPRADLDELYGVWMEEVRAANVNAIGGDYWTVWPLFYYSGITAAPGESLPYPVVFRARIFRPRWERTHPRGMRVAVIADSKLEKKEFFDAAADCHLSVPIKIESRGRFDIYFVRPMDGR